MDIEFNNKDKDFTLTTEIEELIKISIKETLKNEKISENCNVSVSFVTKDEIKRLNKDFRSMDQVTDVLSFPMNEWIGDYQLLGDIVLCPMRATEQANDLGHSTQREFMYLTVHSMLHLLGYDHIDEKDKILMRDTEKEIIRSIGIFRNEL